MPKIKPIVVKTPEELADALGLPPASAEEWQFQHALLERLKEIADGKNLRISRLRGAGELRGAEYRRS